MSKTISGNNQTLALPTQQAGDHERILVVNPANGASVALQYKCGDEWLTARNYSAQTIDRIFIKGHPAQLVFAGQSTVELGD